jgi:hypothetical protein
MATNDPGSAVNDTLSSTGSTPERVRNDLQTASSLTRPPTLGADPTRSL